MTQSQALIYAPPKKLTDGTVSVISSALHSSKGETMRSVKHTRSFEMPVPVETLFPMFSPEGEKHWAPGWDYENVMGTTDLSEDYVFLTGTHDHGTTEAVWIVKAYDPESHFVQFYKVEPGDKVGVITVLCEELENSNTRVRVTYRYIPLSETGEAFVSAFDEKAYDAFIGEWKRLLSEYFESR
jgi:hypothetical protein